MKPKLQPWIIVLITASVIIPSVFIIAQSISKLRTGDKSELNKAVRYTPREIGQDTKVVVSRENAEGVTNEQITPDVANQIGEFTLDRMKVHAQTYLDAVGSKDSVSRMRQESVVTEIGNYNIAVSKIYISDVNVAVNFAGIQGSDFVRVGCSSSDGTTVLVSGKCNAALKDAFGQGLSL